MVGTVTRARCSNCGAVLTPGFRVFLPFNSVILSARQVCISKHLSGLLGASQRVNGKVVILSSSALCWNEGPQRNVLPTLLPERQFLGKEDIHDHRELTHAAQSHRKRLHRRPILGSPSRSPRRTSPSV